MTTHQTNSNHYINLNDEDHPEERESDARHRASASGNEAPNSSSSIQDNTNSSNQPKRKELSSGFTYFYGALEVFWIVRTAVDLFRFIPEMKGEVEKWIFVVSAWFLMTHVNAFLGLLSKNLRKIEKSFTMIKIYFPLIGVVRLVNLFQAIATQKRYGTRHRSPVFDVLSVTASHFIIVYLFAFLTTRKVRNTWNTVIQEEEEMLEHQAQDADPIEKLDSLKFTIYKYALLVYFCWEAKTLISGVYDDFSDFPKFWREMMSDTSYLMMQIYVYPFFPLSMFTTLLAFEGLRRKNLEKVLASIKLMKIHLVVTLTMVTLTFVIRFSGGTLRERWGASSDLEVLIIFLISELFNALLYYIRIYFTSQVRDILKANQKSTHIL